MSSDAADIVRINNEYNETKMTEEDYLNKAKKLRHVVRVATTSRGAIIGFAVIIMTKHKFEIVHIGVAQQYIGRGVEAYLLKDVINRLDKNRNHLEVFVDDKNKNQIAALSKMKSLFAWPSADGVIFGYHLDLSDSQWEELWNCTPLSSSEEQSL